MKRWARNLFALIILLSISVAIAFLPIRQADDFVMSLFIILGLLLIVLCIYLCRLIARDKDLSLQYGWFGLLLIVGVIVVALMPRGKSAAEILTEHRQLLEMGLITSEEFAQKKANLLQR